MTTTSIQSAHNGRTKAVPRPLYRNVGETERWASLVGGSLLAVYGLSRLSRGGWLFAALGAGLAYRGATGHCSLYSALGKSTAQPRGSATSVAAGKGVKLEQTITVNRAPGDVYRYWKNLENLPRFMRHIHSIMTQGDRSHWIVKGPLGITFEWDAEIFNDRPNELIAWRSLPGGNVDNAGSVHFEALPGGGTRVSVSLKYDPPAGRVGAAVAHLFGKDPEAQIKEDLGRFKQLMEAGEGATGPSHPTARFDWNTR